MELFYLPIQPFLLAPWLALAPAALFWLGFRQRRSRLAALAGAVWLVYCIYEWAMHEWSKTVIAPIRIDLLLIAPLLYLATAAGILGLLSSRRRT